jgi:DNA-binding MarR family transcriptional regulator
MTNEVSISQDEYERLHEFRYVIRRFLHFSEQAAREAGIDPQQHQLLLTIQARGAGAGVAIGEIAERLQVRHHSAVELVDRAAARSVVRRETSEIDRRQVLVSLTPEGVRVLRVLSAAHIEELRQAAPALVQVLAEIAVDRRAATRP